MINHLKCPQIQSRSAPAQRQNIIQQPASYIQIGLIMTVPMITTENCLDINFL